MSARQIKVAGSYLAGYGLLVFFVVLLSFIFSFLGTIFCAALAGMMLSAVRQGRWQAIPLSLLFPGVIFASLRTTHVELTSGQIKTLALLCFGIFWFTFAMTSVLINFERKKPPPPSKTKSGPR